MPFVAYVCIPGYMPMDDDPPVFDTAPEAWAWLAEERERAEDECPDDEPLGEYTETVGYLQYAATSPDAYKPHNDWLLDPSGTGVIGGSTPGYTGDHDLGLLYCVSTAQ